MTTDDPGVTYGGADTEQFNPGTPAPDLDHPIDPAAAAHLYVFGATIVARAGDLWDALTQISHTNTARPAIEIVTDAALKAALPLVAEPD